MKRDMELIRKILIKMEAHPQPMGIIPLEFEGYTDEVVSYQVKLLAGRGMIEATDCSSGSGFGWKARRLTWDGHDFIEAIKDEERWKKAKRLVADAGKILTIETLKQAVCQLFL